ncbi:MAG: NAD(P)/FAD-dependent oxidoreductase [Acidimicrobiales bacterium]|nr:NAD(P)/FAD-dependent oxidoreductase [Acidimicrobiales bacterium]
MNARGTSRRIIVIGAGPGGICATIGLLQAGFEDIVVLDRAEGVGGTWWHNSYPGAACDVPTHLYSFSFELNAAWSRPYATQPEIQRYLEHVVDRYGVRPLLRLGTGVQGLYWDDECLVWRVLTDGGEELEADAVISAIGMFNELSWPQLPGLEDFEGTLFHSARWRHDHDLTGRRVAVIGSAASAVQFVPEIAPSTSALHVFQRTANWVLPKEDTPFDPETLAELQANPISVRRRRWKLWRELNLFTQFNDVELLGKAERAGLRNLSVVADPEVRAKLTPSEPYGCKRPLISNDWYPTFNLPQVELVTDPIARVTATGVVTADGTHREVDTIIAATGFQVQRYLSALDVTGRGGRDLREAWADGAQAYLGIATHGFPNLFMLYGPNTNQGSIIYMIECQVAYIVRHLQRLDAEELVWMDVKAEAQTAYNAALQSELERFEVWNHDCNHYYRSPSGRIVTQFPGDMANYRDRTAQPDDDAYEVHAGRPFGTRVRRPVLT